MQAKVKLEVVDEDEVKGSSWSFGFQLLVRVDGWSDKTKVMLNSTQFKLKLKLKLELSLAKNQ